MFCVLGYGDVLRRKKLITKQRMLRRHRLREQQRKQRAAEKKKIEKERAAAVEQQMQSLKGGDGVDVNAAVNAQSEPMAADEEEEAANAVDLGFSDDEDDDNDDADGDLKVNEEELKELEDVEEDDIASYLKTPVALKLSDYDHFAKEWLQRVTEWNLHVEALRLSSPLMNYFTINNVRTLIDRINRILKQVCW